MQGEGQGYSFRTRRCERPDAIANADTNPASIAIAWVPVERDLGLIRGSLGVDFERRTYGDFELDNGTTLSQEDRDRNLGTPPGGSATSFRRRSSLSSSLRRQIDL